MPEKKRTRFLRKTIKVGNSAGVLLPKYLLGADVRIMVVNPPLNIKRDTSRILEPFLEDIIGIYLLKLEKKKAQILAVSTKLSQQIEKGNYRIDIVPLNTLKKSLKQNKSLAEKIKTAKTIINKKLLLELRQLISVLAKS